MNRIRKDFPLGYVVYREPNVIECVEIKARLGVSDVTTDNQFQVLASLMRQMQDIMLEINIEVDGRKVTSWDEMIEIPEMLVPMQEMANELFLYSRGVFPKKKPASDQEASQSPTLT